MQSCILPHITYRNAAGTGHSKKGSGNVHEKLGTGLTIWETEDRCSLDSLTPQSVPFPCPPLYVDTDSTPPVREATR